MLAFKVLVLSGLVPLVFSYPTNVLSALLRREEGDVPYVPPSGCESACQTFPTNRVTATTCLDAYILAPETAPEQTCCTAPIFSSFHDCAACIAKTQPDTIDVNSADYILTYFNEIIDQCNKGAGEDQISTLSLLSAGQSGSQGQGNGAISHRGWTLFATAVTASIAAIVM